MELGEVICLPNAIPKCEICPLSKYCAAHQKHTESSIPRKVIKKDKKEVELIQVNNMLEVGGKIDRKDNAFEKLMIIYTSAMKTLRTKLDVLNEEFKAFYDYNPIDHITERIKSPESIIEKMNKKNLELTYENLIEEIKDIAGIRNRI